ncbi:MAG TPA: hypothetical protein VF765_08460 [Polyangiaceae bacterium]
MRSFRVLALAASALAALTACSSNSSQGSSAGGAVASSIPFAGPDVALPSGAVLQPDVVTVHGGASALAGVSADHGVWTLKKSAGGVSQIAPGKVVLIAGLDCARATAVQDNGSTIDVTVEPVSLTDVFQEADFAWNDAMLDMSQGYLGRVPYGTVVAGEQTPDAGADGGGDGGLSMGLRLQDDRGMGTSVSLTIGHWTVSGGFSTSASGADESVTLTWNPSSGGSNPPMPGDPAQTLGGINVGVVLKMHVASVQGSSGAVAVHGGALTNGSLNAPVGGSVDLSAQVGTPMGAQFPKQALLKLPLSIEWPIFWGPVPFYISVQANLLIQPSLSTANATLGVSSHIDFGGNSGITFSNGSVSGTSSPTAMPPDNPLNNLMAPPSLGTQAMVVAVEAPRVGFGIGTQAFGLGIKAGPFVDIVNSFGITVASSMALVPCQSISWDFTSQGGVEFKLPGGLGVTKTVDISPPTHSALWYAPGVAACKP